jgi:murein DD-endopeptidase MepM/ murein hydrolase activator NlpD
MRNRILKNLPRGVLQTVAVLLLATLPLAAAGPAYVKQYTPMLSAPSEKSGKPLKNLAINEVVTVVYTEEALEQTDLSQAWVRIRASDGREGFVRLGMLAKELQPEGEVAVAFRSIDKKSYVTADALYVRTRPDRGAPEAGMLVRNTEVIVLEMSDNDDYIDGRAAKWARVRALGEVEGWVFSGYLGDEPRADSVGPANEPKEDPNHISSGNSKTVKPPYLSVRDEPSAYGTVIGRIRQGKSVRIVERQASWESLAGLRSVWVRVQADGIDGWVFGGFLSSSGYTMSSDSLDKPFILPLDPSSYRRTSKYGGRTHPISKVPSFHTGVDLAASGGTPIYAAADGVVEVQNDHTGYGILTVVRHENGLVSYYAHQRKRYKQAGDRVAAGEVIGEVGTTGNSTGNHLHFEVRTNYNDTHFNPDLYVPFPEVQDQ